MNDSYREVCKASNPVTHCNICGMEKELVYDEKLKRSAYRCKTDHSKERVNESANTVDKNKEPPLGTQNHRRIGYLPSERRNTR